MSLEKLSLNNPKYDVRVTIATNGTIQLGQSVRGSAFPMMTATRKFLLKVVPLCLHIQFQNAHRIKKTQVIFRIN